MAVEADRAEVGTGGQPSGIGAKGERTWRARRGDGNPSKTR